MKKSNYSNQKIGKGFYIALIVSVIAVGLTAYFTVFNMENKLNERDLRPEIQDVTDWSVPEIEEVAKNQLGVIIEEASEDSQPESQNITLQDNKKGAYIMPVTGEIINPFSNKELVKNETLGEWRTHDGIDIKANEGTPVKSCFDGIVKDITNDAKWGITVEVEYPDVTAYYCGLLDTVKVKKGQEIKLGDVIGEVGNTSIVESTEDFHLHLAMKKDGEWIDPMEIITKN